LAAVGIAALVVGSNLADADCRSDSSDLDDTCSRPSRRQRNTGAALAAAGLGLATVGELLKDHDRGVDQSRSRAPAPERSGHRLPERRKKPPRCAESESIEPVWPEVE
jgi:hypothetical protein